MDATLQHTSREYLSLVAPKALEIMAELELDDKISPENAVPLQALRDLYLSGETRPDVVGCLQFLSSAQTRSSASDLLTMRRSLSMALNAESDACAGYDGARQFRNEIGMNGEPVDTDRLENLIKRFAVMETCVTANSGNQSAVGLHKNGNAAVMLFLSERTERPWVRRMELARALGHLLLDPQTSGGIVGSASSRIASGPRKRRSGAFAAEFLMPAEGMRRIIGRDDPAGDRVFLRILDNFQVGAYAAAYHLWNYHLIEDYERDALIEKFAEFNPQADSITTQPEE
jgi:hypothetical protein